MNALAPDLLDRFRNIVGPKGWSSDPDALALHTREMRDLYTSRTPLVLKPASTEEVAAIVKLARATKTKLVPQGGNTGLVGGGIPFDSGDEIVVSLQRMNRIRAIDPLNDTITVEAGCILQNIQQAAREAGKLFPLSIGSEGSCTIGGNLSTNAGGNAVLRYGNTRDLTLGLEVVLPDGQIWDGLRGLRKDNTGYDLKHLFIGGEGTLGIITAAVLKLYPAPAAVATAFSAVPNPRAAIELLSMAKTASGGQVTGFELLPRIGLDYVLRHTPATSDPLAERYPWYVLMEFSSGRDDGSIGTTLETVLADGFEKGLVLDAAIAQSEAQRTAFWKIREAMSSAQKPEGGSIKTDISVPVSLMPDFIEQASKAVEDLIPGVRIVAFGHIGDGNVHFNPSQPVGWEPAKFMAYWDQVHQIVHDIAHKMNGSISAEHGVGRMKIDEITQYKSPVEIELMRKIKRAFDPDNIMNPGKVIRP
ncbi:FAD-binding oxidoreductase [uncultured Ferrovibrio sp.]|jgi:FAD/FMN-containing dehydrogenases|uniref:FAD-binding oxidoreductase n=1 Tax=uncultured Ferrovibrio sp. TaxID=1576913 RepID=UPI00260BF6FA|nr:FAD-binding oxidoreductase [uncultured Ferrovibrio sp.]